MFATNVKFMPKGLQAKLNNLLEFANQFASVSVALSGGVDSMLLTYVLHRYSASHVNAVHAASPAVPKSALQRIQAYSSKHQWNLRIVDAKELDNPNYRSNPVNRCYFCKSSLYQRIGKHACDVIFSGTNMDDLGDYRPGLIAAAEHKVHHPYVEANISKVEIYQLAKYFGLTDLQALPAQPCLASRIETGISVSVADLEFIDEMERLVRSKLPKLDNIRCRITHNGVVIELAKLPAEPLLSAVIQQVTQACLIKGRVFVEVREYQKGSAFLTEQSNQWTQIEIKQVS
ncbi:ATP-binding protein [Catenovulum agarivorans]|nr:ATP-binding protein [Catenovulum agarivorans]